MSKPNEKNFIFWMLSLSVVIAIFFISYQHVKTKTNNVDGNRNRRSLDMPPDNARRNSEINPKRKKYITKHAKINDKHRKDIDSSEEKRFQYHNKVVDHLFADNIKRNLDYLSSTVHLAGTEESNKLAKWVKHKFKKCGLDNVAMRKYNVLLSYPLGAGNLTLFNKDGKETQKISVIEKKLDSFEKSAQTQMFPPFLAFSKSSSVEAEIVYANFGTDEDFRTLKKLNVEVKDKIVLIRYGATSRNKKIKYAEAWGVKGVILFSDPGIYSPTGVWYPDSWYLPPDGVQRGTLLPLRGDPLTRGYPAIKGLYQRSIEEVSYLPKVPVQPLGFQDAEKLLGTLDGMPPPSDKWQGALNITYNITSRDKRKIKLHVNVTKEVRNITNVIGIIRGAIEPDRIVIVGNHRDAWGYGAADPSSGTAVMLEVVRALGWLKEKGWRPRRTIMFCNWDAEEYGLFGSTEWTEEYAKVLSHKAVAYLNVDIAVQGNHTIQLKTTPELADVFFDAARNLKDPDTKENLYDAWVKKHEEDQKDKRREPEVNMIGMGSDYVPFYADLGIPAMDFRYMFTTKDMGMLNYPVYHTIHDDIDWMRNFVDRDLRYHVTIAEVWTQVILLLADATLLPFNFVRYSNSLNARVTEMMELVKSKDINKECDFSLLNRTVKELQNAAKDFHSRLRDLDKTDALAVREANDQMLLFQRTFVTSEDIPGEPLTRHAFHTDRLSKALDGVARDRTSKKMVKEFRLKYSIYTYHVMMAIQALKDPFSDMNDDDDDGVFDPSE